MIIRNQNTNTNLELIKEIKNKVKKLYEMQEGE